MPHVEVNNKDGSVAFPDSSTGTRVPSPVPHTNDIMEANSDKSIPEDQPHLEAAGVATVESTDIASHDCADIPAAGVCKVEASGAHHNHSSNVDAIFPIVGPQHPQFVPASVLPATNTAAPLARAAHDGQTEDMHPHSASDIAATQSVVPEARGVQDVVHAEHLSEFDAISPVVGPQHPQFVAASDRPATDTAAPQVCATHDGQTEDMHLHAAPDIAPTQSAVPEARGAQDVVDDQAGLKESSLEPAAIDATHTPSSAAQVLSKNP